MPMTQVKKLYKKGGKTKAKKYAGGGSLKMVKNSKGEEVPFYAADGEGKMKGGGKVKGYKSGGMARGCGAATRGRGHSAKMG